VSWGDFFGDVYDEVGALSIAFFSLDPDVCYFIFEWGTVFVVAFFHEFHAFFDCAI